MLVKPETINQVFIIVIFTVRIVIALISEVVLTQATIKALEVVCNLSVVEAEAKVDHGQMEER